MELWKVTALTRSAGEEGLSMKITYKAGMLAAAGVLAMGSLAACSGSSNNTPSPGPTETSASASASATETNQVGATCDKTSLQSVVPNGASINKFNCGKTGGGQIAAVEYSPGTNVIFAKTTGVGGNWEIVNKNTICGTASAGLPAEVLNYCKNA